MKITPVTDAFGAIVEDIDLDTLSPRQFEEVLDAWHVYAVLLFPNQQVSDEQHLKITKRFGRLEIGLKKSIPAGAGRFSNVDNNGNFLPTNHLGRRFNIGNSVWHTDSSYKRVAAKASLLAAQVVPELGGETEWADMRAGYDQLSDHIKQWLADKIAVHSYRYSHAWHGGLDLLTAEELAELPPVQHRIVKTHPDSRRKVLFVGRHASHILGEDFMSSRRLLRELTFDAARSPRIWTHKWRVGDLVIWDNRCVLHRARSMPSDQPRRMVRTTVAGDDPNNEWAESLSS